MTHHHHAGHSHPPVQIGPSILRASALYRLGIAVICGLVLWAAVYWAVH